MNLSEKVRGAVDKTAPRASGVATVLSEEATIEGKISSKGNLRVEGRVEGEVFAEDTVVLGSGGNVEGNIEARTVIIGGTVTGNVRASDKIEIQPQGTVHGDVFTPYGRLVIEEGARLEGKCAMTKDVQLSSAAARPRVVDAAPPKLPEPQKKTEGAD